MAGVGALVVAGVAALVVAGVAALGAWLLDRRMDVSDGRETPGRDR